MFTWTSNDNSDDDDTFSSLVIGFVVILVTATKIVGLCERTFVRIVVGA